ncbi:aspartyl/glutamyl-tRNA(Asn/Gln) amidotransferase subunit C [Candidatus Saccharibacteria bacterium 32-49-10]|nr:MAG: aspartyl/glutamyl-tRNA(Asn/Gln) amidotransferase subunit C [Candidatus Saccharibacteria bacterium 32-49-10]
MTKFSTSDITHLATLSGLSLADDEVEHLRTDLESIIHYVDKLDELDVSGVEPTYQLTQLSNVTRDDVVSQGAVSSERLVELAPESLQGQIKVPKVL